MRTMILLLLTLVIAACAPMRSPSNPQIDQEAQRELRKQDRIAFQLIVDARDRNLPPIDLSKYNGVTFKIVTIDNVNYIVFEYTDYALLIELLEELRGRIVIQEQTIDSLIEFNEQRLGAEEVD